MSKVKERYYYSKEEDEVIVKTIRDDFLRRQNERKMIERIWELNLNFYMGNQYSYITNTGSIIDIEKLFKWENREVFNHIAPIIECRLAKLNKIKPALTVRAASEEQNDVANAKIAKSLIRSAFDTNSIDSLISLATMWSEITGTAFYKITWDNALGNVIGVTDENNIKNGDAVISICSPFEIYPDSNTVVEIDDCESIIQVRAYPAEFIKLEYGVVVSGDDIDMYEFSTSLVNSNFAGHSNAPKILHSSKQGYVLLIERYEKPSMKRPNGRFSVICKDKLLFDGELPFKDENGNGIYPFVKQVSTKQVNSFWGSSVIERCIPLQRAYNAIKNKKHEYITRLASGVLAVEDGSVDIDSLESDGLPPGKVLVYRTGSKPPSFMDSGSVPVELEKEEANLLSEMNNLCCVSDISVSSTFPSNISSGSALSILIQQDESRLSLVGENIRIAIKKIGERVLRLYKQFASGQRIIKVANLKGSTDIVFWDGTNLGCDDVIFETINEFEESLEKQKELILKLYEKGMFNDENGEVSQSAKKNILELLGIYGYDAKETESDMHKKCALSENQDIENIAEPMELDDHNIHITEHIKHLLKDKNIKNNLVMKQKLINHIKEHKKILKEEE